MLSFQMNSFDSKARIVFLEYVCVCLCMSEIWQNGALAFDKYYLIEINVS